MFPLPMFFIMLYLLYLFIINISLKNEILYLQKDSINNTMFENNNKNSISHINRNKDILFEYNSEYLHIPQFHPQLILI